MTRQDLPAGLAVTRTLARATVCALVSALSLAACTGGASPEATPIPTTVGPAPGPLEAYLGEGADAGGAGGRTEAEVAAEVAAREEAVAACMAAHGFEYWPPTIVPGTFQTSDEPLRGTREFAERYGYGVWTGPEVEPGQHAYQLDDSANAGYRASLTPEARRAYDEALHGRLTEVPDGWVSDGTGCTELAAVRLSPEAEYLRGVQAEAVEFLESLWRGDDPRLAEVDAAWASCMRGAGYDVDSPAAAEQQVIAGATAITVWTADVVDAGAQAERTLALADQDCRDATGWTDRRRAVEHALQQEYLDAHRADLDVLADVLAHG